MLSIYYSNTNWSVIETFKNKEGNYKLWRQYRKNILDSKSNHTNPYKRTPYNTEGQKTSNKCTLYRLIFWTMTKKPSTVDTATNILLSYQMGSICSDILNSDIFLSYIFIIQIVVLMGQYFDGGLPWNLPDFKILIGLEINGWELRHDKGMW